MCGIFIPHTAFGLHYKVLQFTVWLHYKAWKVIMIILKKTTTTGLLAQHVLLGHLKIPLQGKDVSFGSIVMALMEMKRERD